MFGGEPTELLLFRRELTALRKYLWIHSMEIEEFAMHACVNYPKNTIQAAILGELKRRIKK